VKLNESGAYNRKAELIDLRSDLLANQIECSIREDRLRRFVGVNDESLYGYPLSPDAL
jgi:adhesin transport system outer membrane protein